MKGRQGKYILSLLISITASPQVTFNPSQSQARHARSQALLFLSDCRFPLPGLRDQRGRCSSGEGSTTGES